MLYVYLVIYRAEHLPPEEDGNIRNVELRVLSDVVRNYFHSHIILISFT